MGRLHRLYVEECGNLDGNPVVFLHGGSGAGCEANHRRFFDPERYRIILFDRRGRRSTPHTELRGADRMAEIPGVIVHGRYDMICPLENAWAPHCAWPRSELHVVPDAGHAASEPGITKALVAATDRFAELLA